MSTVPPIMEAARGTLQELGRIVERAPAEVQPPGAVLHLHRLAQELAAQIANTDRPVTVAVVGEFKVGKSTLLNGLLGLSGGAALSAEDSPDTARSILVRARRPGDPEARLRFAGDRPAQDVAWAEARGLTSQVLLDQDRTAAARARDLVEVEYFVTAPLLERFQFNDLPGTGAHSHLHHTEIAHQRMKLADAVLWVVAGDREPGADARGDLDVLA